MLAFFLFSPVDSLCYLIHTAGQEAPELKTLSAAKGMRGDGHRKFSSIWFARRRG